METTTAINITVQYCFRGIKFIVLIFIIWRNGKGIGEQEWTGGCFKGLLIN